VQFVVTNEVDDRTVQGLNITCGAHIDIEPANTIIFAVSPITLLSTSKLTDRTVRSVGSVATAASAPPARSKSSLLSFAYCCNYQVFGVAHYPFCVLLLRFVNVSINGSSSTKFPGN